MNLKIASFILASLFLLPISIASPVEDIKNLESKVMDFMDSTSDNTIIIEGKYASTTEKLAFKFVKDLYPKINNMEYLSEEQAKNRDLSKNAIILIGGIKQNQLSKDYVNDNSNKIEQEKTSLGSLLFIETQTNQRLMIFSDKKGMDQLPNIQAHNSPLNKFLPVGFVPTAAAIIGLTLMWSSNFFISLLKKIFRFIISSRLMRLVSKKDIKEEFSGFHLKGLRIKYREWFNIDIAATIFALSLGFMYLSPYISTSKFLLITILVNILIYGFRHFIRIFLDKKHQTHTEYHLWIYGALITAITAWLGNVFSLAGYISKNEQTTSEQAGKISYSINISTFFLFLLFWIINFVKPSTFIQIAMLLTLSLTFLQMLPFSPFSGKAIYQWKKKKWWSLFLPTFIFYLLINLLI